MACVVRESRFARLRELDAGSWRGSQWKDERIPSLAEVLATVPAGRRIYIEVKCGPDVVPAVMQGCASAGLTPEQTLVISFDPLVIAAARKLCPDRLASLLMSLPTDRVPPPAEILDRLGECAASAIGTSVTPYVDAAWIAAFHEAGYSYHVWTVDDPREALRLAAAGVDSITTNRPAFIRQCLRQAAG